MPPYTRSANNPQPEFRAEPVYQGPRFARTRNMSRWHRVRSGVTIGGSRVCWHLWCGYTINDAARALAADSPTGLPACGTCEGRAIGAGQEDNEGPRDLIFLPAGISPPRWCPGSRTELCDEVPDPRGWPRFGICLVCGSQERMSASGGPYNSHYGLKRHAPGLELRPGCPLHAYQFLRKGPDSSLWCYTCSRPL